MKSNMSTGIDIVSIDRIKEILTSSKRERFLKKIFSPNEIKEGQLRQNEAQFFSGRFAAKEAIRKATSTPHNPTKLTFKSIEIFNYASGKPGADLNNESVVDISISHDGNYAVAFCVVQ